MFVRVGGGGVCVESDNTEVGEEGVCVGRGDVEGWAH
jgi:hypothetical protein